MITQHLSFWPFERNRIEQLETHQSLSLWNWHCNFLNVFHPESHRRKEIEIDQQRMWHITLKLEMKSRQRIYNLQNEFGNLCHMPSVETRNSFKKLSWNYAASNTETALQEFFERLPLHIEKKILRCAFHEFEIRTALELEACSHGEFLKTLHLKSQTEIWEQDTRNQLAVNFMEDLIVLRSEPLRTDEEWDRADMEFTETLSRTSITSDYRNETFNLLTMQLVRTVFSEKETLLHEREKALETMKNRMITKHLNVEELSRTCKNIEQTIRLSIKKRKHLYREVLNDEPHQLKTEHLVFSNKVKLPLALSLHALLNHPICNALNIVTRNTLLQNKHTIHNLATEWNLIEKIYEHPIHGIVMIRFEHQLKMHCFYSGMDTRTHLLVRTHNQPGKTLSSKAWTNSIQLFRNLTINCGNNYKLTEA